MGGINRIFAIGLLLAVSIPRLVVAEVNGEQVKKAIAGGVEYLKGQQNKADGSWTDIPLYGGGVTALVT